MPLARMIGRLFHGTEHEDAGEGLLVDLFGRQGLPAGLFPDDLELAGGQLLLELIGLQALALFGQVDQFRGEVGRQLFVVDIDGPSAGDGPARIAQQATRISAYGRQRFMATNFPPYPAHARVPIPVSGTRRCDDPAAQGVCGVQLSYQSPNQWVEQAATTAATEAITSQSFQAARRDCPADCDRPESSLAATRRRAKTMAGGSSRCCGSWL